MNPTTTAQNPVDNHVWPRLDAGPLWTHPSSQVYHPDPLTSPRERKRRRGRSPTPIPLPGARLDLHLSPSLINTASHNANSTRSTIASRTDRPGTEGRREAGGKGKGKRTSEDSFDEDQVGHDGNRASSEGGSESTVTEKPRKGLQAHLGRMLGHGLGMDRGVGMVQLPDLPIHPPQQIDQLITSNRHIEPLQFFTNPLIPIEHTNILSHGDNPPSFALPGISTYQGVMPVQSIWPTTTHAPAPTAPTYPVAPLRNNMFDRGPSPHGHNDGLSIFNVLMRQSEGLGRELSVDEKRRRNAMWIEADRQRAMASTTLQPPTNRWQTGQPDSRDLSPFREAAAEAHEVESIAPSIYGIKRESRGAGGREAWLKDMHKLIQEEVGLALKDVTGKLLQQRQGKKRR